MIARCLLSRVNGARESNNRTHWWRERGRGGAIVHN